MKDDPYRVLDESMALLEEVEEEVGRLAAKARSGEKLQPGEVYRLYTLVLDVGERLRRLRAILYDSCK